MIPRHFAPGPHSPLQPDEAATVQLLLDALASAPRQDAIATTILDQAQSLDAFGALLARYPSPLEEQQLGGRRRSLDTLVDALCGCDHVSMALRAPTQAIVGRALNLAQTNFFRLLWHVCSELETPATAAALRERTARLLRTSVYTQLVEEVLSDLVADAALPHALRARAVRQLALLWGHRLTWRVSAFLPLLEATWEARSRVRVVGGTLLGTSEVFQLMTQGADERFVDLLTGDGRSDEAALAFREFLFERGSEQLERLVERMAQEQRSSIELDSQLGRSERDAGSLFFEFFEARFLQSIARRLAGLPGPKRTAEGYVVLAWLERMAE
jgi:hypothetical protein